MFGGLDTSSARWARVDIAHGWTQDSVLDAELLPTNVTVVDIPKRYRRSDATIAAGELADGRLKKRKRLEKRHFFLGIQKGR